MGAVQGIFPLNLDENALGINLRPASLHLCVGRGRLNLAEDQFGNENGLLAGLQADGVGPFREIEQEGFLGIPPGITQGLPSKGRELHLCSPDLIAQAVPHDGARIAENTVEEQVASFGEGSFAVEGELQFHAGPPALHRQVNQGQVVEAFLRDIHGPLHRFPFLQKCPGRHHQFLFWTLPVLPDLQVLMVAQLPSENGKRTQCPRDQQGKQAYDADAFELVSATHVQPSFP